MSEKTITAMIMDDHPQLRGFLKDLFRIHRIAVVEACSIESGLHLPVLPTADVVVVSYKAEHAHSLRLIQKLKKETKLKVIACVIAPHDIPSGLFQQLGIDATYCQLTERPEHLIQIINDLLHVQS